MRAATTLAGIACLSLFMASHPLPVSAQPLSSCIPELASSDSLKQCDKDIASNSLSGHALAFRHYERAWLKIERGLELERKGDKGAYAEWSRKAIVDIDEAIKMDPKRAGNYGLRCEALSIIGAVEEALKACNRFIEMFPEGRAYMVRAEANARRSLYEVAIIDYTNAIRLKDGLSLQSTAFPLFRRGCAHLARGETVLADQDFKEANKLINGVAVKSKCGTLDEERLPY